MRRWAAKDGAVMRKSKGGWVLYLLIHIPFFWWVKIGITSVGIGAAKRAKNLDKAMFGFPVPIFFVVVPNAYGIEQTLHHWFRRFNCKWYSKDGSSEWFWFPVAIPTLAIMLSIIGCYLALIDACFGTQVYPAVSMFFFNALFWIFERITQ